MWFGLGKVGRLGVLFGVGCVIIVWFVVCFSYDGYFGGGWFYCCCW